MSEVLFIAQLMRDLVAVYAGVFVHFWRAPVLRHISGFGVCECVEASCGFAGRCDGVAFGSRAMCGLELLRSAVSAFQVLLRT